MAVCEVIVPFFQRRPGVLRAALEGALSQAFEDIRIIVVDDGSPSPCEADLIGLSPEQRARITLVAQENAGAGAARNRALDEVAPDAEFVAFLDSDDVWAPEHLQHAVETMRGAGVDFYWCALTPDLRFDRFVPPCSAIEPGDLRRLEGVADAHEVLSLRRALTGPWWTYMHLSCTVVSAELARTVRFRTDLRYCEDFDFFIQCAGRAQRAAVSNFAGAARGVGENMWHGVAFSDPRNALEKLLMTSLLLPLRREFGDDPDSRRRVDRRIQSQREQFLQIQWRRLRRSGDVDADLWLRWLKMDLGLIGAMLSRPFKSRRPEPLAAPGRQEAEAE